MEVKDNFTELFLSFYLYVGPENRTLVSKLVLQGLLSPEPSYQKIRLLEDHSLSSTQQASDLNAASLFEIFLSKAVPSAGLVASGDGQDLPFGARSLGLLQLPDPDGSVQGPSSTWSRQLSLRACLVCLGCR